MGHRAARPESVRIPLGCGLGLWGPQSDARYCCGHRRRKLHIIRFRAGTKTHSFRCSSSPQKVLRLFGDPETPIFAGLPECRFSVPAPESHRSVVSLSLLTQKVLAKSYPIQPVIPL